MKYLVRALATSVLFLFAFGLFTEYRAEVSVRTDRKGQYLRTQVIPVGPSWAPKIWSVRSRGVRFRALNPRGDLNGDLWSTVVDSPEAPNHPWAVWSRFDGERYSIVWARWTERGWSDILRVARVPGDDLDPDLAFDSTGRPYVVWWARDETGGGIVYISVFLVNRWMEPFQISRSTVDARYPAVAIEEDGRVRVDYFTPQGSVNHFLSIALPVTITDDINPQVQSTGFSFTAYKP